jgi:sugar phosphate isomerase/epimerase
LNRLSLAPLTINEAGPLELIDAAAAGKFDGVSLRLLAPPDMVLPAEILRDPSLQRAIRERLAATGLSLFGATGFFLMPDIGLPEPEPALDCAARLGARSFLAVGYEPDEDRLVESVGRLCDAAARFGLEIALEFQPYGSVKRLSDAARILDRAARPNGTILVDALHLARSGGAPSDVAKIPRARIGYLQLCDAPLKSPPSQGLRQESRHGRLLPGTGELPLFELLDALPRDVEIDVECPGPALQGLHFAERARRAGDATRRFLAAHAERGCRG